MPSPGGDSEELARRVTELEAENRRLRDLLGLDREDRAVPVRALEPTLFPQGRPSVVSGVTQRSRPEQKVAAPDRGILKDDGLAYMGVAGTRRPDPERRLCCDLSDTSESDRSSVELNDGVRVDSVPRKVLSPLPEPRLQSRNLRLVDKEHPAELGGGAKVPCDPMRRLEQGLGHCE